MADRNIRFLRKQLADGRLDRREFLRLATLLGLAAPTAYSLIGLADPFAGRAAAATPEGGVLRFAQRVHEMTTPHTFETGAQSNMGRQALEYLAVTGPDNITRPHLLEKWDVSEDLKIWTLFIRPDVRWRTGRKFNADDVIWNIKRVVDPKTGSSVLGLMSGYMLTTTNVDGTGQTVLWNEKAIEKVDDLTVRLNLKEPQIAVPEHFFHYPFVMMDPVEEGVFKPGANSTGPFIFESIVVGEKARFVANKDYWGEKKPKLEAIDFIDLGDDFSVAVNALIADQVDGIDGIPIWDVDRVTGEKHLVLYEASSSQTAVARMKPKGPFKDARIRKAMRLAIDQNQILQVAQKGLGTAAEHHHVAPGHPEYAKLPLMTRDVESAKRLLAEAGFPEGLQTKIDIRNDKWEVSVVLAMKEQWKEIGVDVEVNIMPGATYWDVWKDTDFGFTAWQHRSLGIMNLALAYRSGAPWNESGFSNPEFDKLLKEAEGTIVIEARRKIMAKIEALMQEEGPIVQPTWLNVITAMQKRVKGLVMHPAAVFNFNEMWIEA
jgi:peptide/nickel transport system substrate-binding protein